MSEAQTMSKEAFVPAEGAVDLTKRVTLYAPKGALQHKEGEATEVGEAVADYFRELGYTDKAPSKKDK